MPESLDLLSISDALDSVAEAIDHAMDHRDTAQTRLALQWCDQLDARSLSSSESAVLDYLRANAWSNLQEARVTSEALMWSWEQEESQQQIYFLRRALYNDGFKDLDIVRQCQILTNLANQLDTVGRFIEARAMYSQALRVLPHFWMARGNRGVGLRHYSGALYDPGHAAILALAAHSDLIEAIADRDAFPSFGDPALRAHFQERADDISRHFDLARIAGAYDPSGFAVGVGDEDVAYRLWCLQGVLFLNPLNDLGPNPIAARDIMTLPNFVTKFGEAPVLTGFYNQLKQEFASARWLLFEGTTSSVTHLSDRDVLLYETFDAPVFGLGNEKTKLAFRMSYSLLDKIAYFLNRYMLLGIPEKRVSFRTIWRERDNSPIRQQLADSENWPFRGLYWLSKDLFEQGFAEMTDPEARAFSELRNHLEHKYVKVHQNGKSLARDPANPYFDNFAHSISRDDLERRSLHILKLVRSALMYLSLGMHREEGRRAALKPDAVTLPMKLTPLQK